MSVKLKAVELLMKFDDAIFVNIMKNGTFSQDIPQALKVCNPWPAERIPMACSAITIYSKFISPSFLSFPLVIRHSFSFN